MDFNQFKSKGCSLTLSPLKKLSSLGKFKGEYLYRLCAEATNEWIKKANLVDLKLDPGIPTKG
eukprot:snap_masked-scaffold_22-processed-gene-4.40-mRNA-1 protein AED:1.00 eAED:1.00 QI:0/-1/0/0/-1/1/1/0/62